MSKKVDERVVEMRFDNKQFESGVQTSMSTLDKLKQKLQFKDASKGLDNLNTAVKKVDLNPLGKAAETVTAKFSAMQVAGVTALANLTNSAVNAGKNITKALTITPVMTGFQEYETQLGAIQTILANTQKEGTNVERVNAALDELNLYADQTIYNFTEMTRNIGTFTAAGVKLDESVSAIKGIANLAAVSGSTSLQASTAMYQLSQALAAGKVSLMDWNSVVNAGMGGQVFQDALIRTSENLKTGAKQAIKTAGSFRESLTKSGWLTKEVLTETLGQLAGAYSEADLLAKGYSADQAKEIVKLAETAKSAATDVKTFTQLWDTLKEAVQSGWGVTWRTIVGDFDKAKERMTKLSTVLGEVIEKSSNRRNSMLSGAMDSNWEKLTSKLKDAGIQTEDFQRKIIELANTHGVNLDQMIKDEGSLEKALKKAFSSGKLDRSILIDAIKSFTGGIRESAEAAKTASNQMEKYHEIADKVINGDFGNGAERIQKLTDAGYEYAAVQNIVNERLGSSVRHMSSLTEEQIQNADSLADLSDEQLKNKGYTEEQITALKDLKKAADDSNSSIYKLINGFEKPSGADLAWGSVFNILDAITESCKAVKKAWSDIFHPGMTEDQIIAERSERLYKLLESIHSFTEGLKVNGETAQKITRTFKGLFAILDLIRSVVGGAFSIVFKVVKAVLSAFDMDVLDLTANIGDAIVKFHDWITEHNLLAKAIQFVVPYIKNAVIAVKDWIKNNETIQNVIARLKETFYSATEGIRNWINGIKEADNIPKYILQGLVNGIKNGVGTAVTAIVELGKSLLEGIKSVLGIHSPSTEFFEIGKNIITGLINGIKEGVSSLLSLLGDIGQKCIDVISSIDFSKVFTLAISAGIIFAGKKIYELLDKFAAPMEGLGKMFGGIGHMFNSVGKILDNFARMIKVKKYEAIAKMFLNFGIAIGIMAASIYVLSTIDSGKLWSAVGAITVLGIVMVGLSIAMSKFSDASATIGKDGLKIAGFKTALISIGIAILLIAAVVKMIGTLKPDQAIQGFNGLAGIVAAMAIVIWAFGNLTKDSQNIDKVGGILIKMSVAMLLMVAVVKLLGGMSPDEIAKGVTCIVLFGGVMVGLIALTKLAGEGIDEVGNTILKMSVAMLLMVAVVKLLGGMSPSEIAKGVTCIVLFGGVITGLIAATRLAGDGELKNVASTILAIAGAMALMALTVRLVSGMSPSEIAKGVTCIVLFGGVITGLIAATRLAGDGELKRIASTILAMSIAIGILAAISVLLGLVDIATLAKGVTAVTILGGIMTAMIWATRGAENVKGNIIAMTVAIGVMAAAVVALSFIDTGKLAGATAAMAILMGMFALMTKMAGNAKGAIGPLIVITAAVVAIGGVLYALASLPDTGAALTAAIAVTLLMGAMTAMLYVLNIVGQTAKKMITNVLVGIGGLLLMCVPLLAFIEVLKQMNGIENAERNAIVLTAFMAAMTVLLLAVTGIGYLMLGAAGLAGIAGLLGLAAMIALLYPVVDILQRMDGIQNAEKNVEILIRLMTTLEELFAVVAILGPLALIGDVALLGLIGILAIFGDFAIKVGALMKLFPSLEDFLDKGIPVLEKLAHGLGSVLGNIIAGFGEAVSSALPTIGENIHKFIENVSVDKSIVDGVKRLAEALLIITGASILDRFLNGGQGLIKFGAQLELFGGSLGIFSKNIEDIKPKKMTAAAEAAKKLAETADAIPFDFNFNNIKGFGNQLPALAKGLSDFNDGVKDIKPKKMTAAVEAAKELAETADKIPFDFKFNNIKGFGKQLKALGTGLKDFSSEIAGEKEFDSKKALAAVKAAKEIAEVADKIPFDFKFNNIKGFGNQLKTLGTGLKDFGSEIAGEKEFDSKKALAAVKAAKEIAEVADKIPFDFKFNNIKGFGNQLETLGKGLSKFSSAIVGDGDGEKEFDSKKALDAVKAAKELAETAETLPSMSGDKLTKFGNQLSASGDTSFGKTLSDFCNEFNEINPTNVSAAAGAAKELAGSLATLSDKDINIEKLPDLDSKLKKFGEGIKGFVNATNVIDSNALNNAKTAAETGKALIEAITSIFSNKSNDENNLLAQDNAITSFEDIDMSKIKEKFTSFAEAISGFSGVFTANPIDPAMVSSIADAGGSIITAIREIAPVIEDGESIGFINFKEIDLSNLSDKMETFGSAISGFVSKIVGIGDSKQALDAADVGAKIVDAIKKLATKIGEDEIAFNDISLSNFSTQVANFGSGLSNFANLMPQAEKLDNAIKALDLANGVVDAANKVGDNLLESEFQKKAATGISNFEENMVIFGKGITEFSNAMANINSDRIKVGTDAVNSISTMSFPDAGEITNATKALGELVGAIQTMAGLDEQTIATFNTNLAGLGETGIAKFVEAFAVPNDTVTGAINEFIKSVSTSIEDQKTTMETSGSSLGSSLIDGFVKGITNNQYKATQAVSNAMSDSVEAGRIELDVNSPSKKFMKIGGSVIEGFAKGINKNIGTSNDAAVKMANGVLTATKDELGIHSPSVVFNKEVGRYIVQGIANGIEEETSAEKAAKEKAEAIVSAFQDVFDVYTSKINNRDKDFELWELTDGKTASDIVKAEKLKQKLNDNLWDYNEQVKLNTDKWILLRDTYGENSKYAQEAYRAMRDSQITAAQTAAEYASVSDSLLTSQEDTIENQMDVEEKKRKLFNTIEANGSRRHKIISEAYNKDSLKSDIENAAKLKEIAQNKYDKLLFVDGYDKDSSIVLKQLSELLVRKLDEEQAKQDYFDYINSTYDDDIQKIEDAQARRDRENSYWEATYGDDASDARRFAYYSKRDAIAVEEATNRVTILKNKYDNFLKEYAKVNNVTIDMAKQSDEAKKIEEEIENAQVEEAEAKKQQRDRQKEYLEQEKEDLKEYYGLVSEIADIKYQIWEKTSGRKATDAEKDTMKLAILTKQIDSQARLVEMAKEAWENADLADAEAAEKEYWSARLELANLQSEVLDIQEANIKRQQSALDKQRLAQDEYEDYVKRYEKYYLDHGMTVDDLKRDAKLVSGYDPSKVTNAAVSKTQSAIDNIGENVTSLVKTIGEGIQNGVTEITTSTTSMLDSCADVLKTEKDTWFKAGAGMATGLAEGITSKVQMVVDSVTDLVTKMLSAIQTTVANGIENTSGITPVIDASDITLQSTRSRSLALENARSRYLANSISRSITSSSDTPDTIQSSAPVYSFTQNNYSPKSLSAVEVYRQTNNLISRLGKRVTTI